MKTKTAPAFKITNGPAHHFFGYYDKCPWNGSGSLLACMETSLFEHPPEAGDCASVGVIDPAQGAAFQPLDETSTWNFQQGAMLQWLPGKEETTLVYNKKTEGTAAGVLKDIHTGKTVVLPGPIAALSPAGKFALSINFARLHTLRPGYGYAGISDPYKDILFPEKDGIHLIDIDTGTSRLIISLDQIVHTEYQSLDSVIMEKYFKVYHWFNHLTFNENGTRFAFLHRWQRDINSNQRYTRLFTANIDGSEMHCMSDHEVVSHYCWKGRSQVLAWAYRKDRGWHYFLFDDMAENISVIGQDILTEDGHCTYSPDKEWILTDTYPDKENKRHLLLFHPCSAKKILLGKFFSQPELVVDVRCDLHPRWDRKGNYVCFDSSHDGSRQVYITEVSSLLK